MIHNCVTSVVGYKPLLRTVVEVEIKVISRFDDTCGLHRLNNQESKNS